MRNSIFAIILILQGSIALADANEVAFASREPSDHLRLNEINRWKRILLDPSRSVSLQQKMQALVRLSEIEEADITTFLHSRKAQLDLDIRTGVILLSREVANYRQAINRILATRSHPRLADGETN
jgi:hypothetical protein